MSVKLIRVRGWFWLARFDQFGNRLENFRRLLQSAAVLVVVVLVVVVVALALVLVALALVVVHALVDVVVVVVVTLSPTSLTPANFKSHKA